MIEIIAGISIAYLAHVITKYYYFGSRFVIMRKEDFEILVKSRGLEVRPVDRKEFCKAG